MENNNKDTFTSMFDEKIKAKIKVLESSLTHSNQVLSNDLYGSVYKYMGTEEISNSLQVGNVTPSFDLFQQNLIDGQLNEKGFVLSLVASQPVLITTLPDRFKYDLDVISVAVEKNGSLLSSLGPQYLSNTNLVLKAINSDPNIFLLTDDSIKNNRLIVSLVGIKNPKLLDSMGKSLKDDKEFISTMVYMNPSILTNVSENLKSDPLFVANMVKKGFGYNFASNSLKSKINPSKPLDYLESNEVISKFYKKHPEKEVNTIGHPPPISVPIISPHWRTILSKISLINALNSSYGMPPLHPMFLSYLVAAFHAEEEYYEKLVELNKKPEAPNDTVLQKFVEKYEKEKPIESNLWLVFILSVIAEVNPELAPHLKAFLDIYDMDSFTPIYTSSLFSIQNTYNDNFSSFLTTNEKQKIQTGKVWQSSLLSAKYKTANKYNVYLRDVLPKVSIDNFDNPLANLVKLRTKSDLSVLSDQGKELISNEYKEILSVYSDYLSSEEINELTNFSSRVSTSTLDKLKKLSVIYSTTYSRKDLKQLNQEELNSFIEKSKIPQDSLIFQNAPATQSLLMAENTGQILPNAPDHVLYSKESLLALNNDSYPILSRLGQDKNPLLQDQSLLYELVKNDPNVLEYIAPYVSISPQVLNKAILFNPSVMYKIGKYLDPELFTDPDFIDIAKNSPLLTSFLDKYNKDKTLISEPNASDLDNLLRVCKRDKGLIKLDEIEPKLLTALEAIKSIDTVSLLVSNNPELLKLECFNGFINEPKVAKSYIEGLIRADSKKTEDDVIEAILQKHGDNKEIVLSVLSFYGKNKKILPSKKIDEKLFDDPDFVNRAIAANGMFLGVLPEGYPITREQVLLAASQNGGVLSFERLDPEYKNDPEIILSALKTNGNVINGLSSEQKSDPVLALLAVSSNPYSYQYLEGEAKENRDVIKLTLSKNGNYFKEIPVQLQRDPEFILTALKNNGLMFNQLPKDLQSNHDYIREALLCNFNSIKKMAGNPELSKVLTKELILDSFAKGTGNYKELPAKFTKDTDIAIAAILTNNAKLKELSDKQKANLDIVRASIKIAPDSIENAILDYKSILVLTKETPAIFKNLPDEIKANPEIYSVALSSSSSNFSDLPDNLKNDPKFILSLIKDYPSVLDTIRNTDIELYSALMKDSSFTKKCVKENPYSLQYLRAPSNAPYSKEILIKALLSAQKQGISIEPDDEFIKRIEPFLTPALKKLLNDNAPIESLINQVRLERKLQKLNPEATYDLIATQIKKGFTEVVSSINQSYLENVDFALKLVKLNGSIYHKLSDDFKNDDNIIKVSIESDGQVYSSLATNKPSLLLDENLLLSAIKTFPSAVLYANPKIFNNNDFVEKLILTNPASLKNLPLELPKNEELLTKLISEKPYLYSYLNPPISCDKELSKIALLGEQTNIENFLRSNKASENIDILLKAIEEFPVNYSYLDKESRNIPEIKDLHHKHVFNSADKRGQRVRGTNISPSDRANYANIVKNNPSRYKELPEELINNKAFIFQAIKNNPLVYEFLPENFKNDKNTFLKVLEQNPDLLNKCVSNLDFLEGKKDPVAYLKDSIIIDHDYAEYDEDSKRDFVLSTIVSHPEVLKNITFKYPEDINFALEVVQKNGNCLKYLPEGFKADKDIVLESVSSAGLSIQYADPKLISDRECMLTAIKYNGAAIKYADDNYKLNRDIATKAIMQNPLAIKYLPVQVQNSELLDLAYSLNSDVIKYFPESALNNEKVLSAILNTPNIINDLPDSYKNNYDLIKVAVEKEPSIVFSLDKSFVLENKQLLDLSLEAAKSKNLFNSEFAINLNSIKPYFVPPKELPKVEYINENSDDLKLKDKAVTSTIETPNVSIKVPLSSDSLKDSYTLTEKLKAKPELFFELDYNLRSNPKVVKLALEVFEGTPEAKKIYENKIENSLVEPQTTIEESAREKIARKFR